MFDFSGFSGLLPAAAEPAPAPAVKSARKAWPSFDLAPKALETAAEAHSEPAAEPTRAPSPAVPHGKRPYSGPRTMKSKYSGWCRAGGHSFAAGTEIVWSRRKGATCTDHAA